MNIANLFFFGGEMGKIIKFLGVPLIHMKMPQSTAKFFRYWEDIIMGGTLRGGGGIYERILYNVPCTGPPQGETLKVKKNHFISRKGQ